MPHGWIILDKPLELGSTQAVGAVKRNLREAGFGKVKVGHGGTLDPLATGVLPIALGEATKLCGRMLDASKTYAFTIAFGAETDTLDLEGKVIATSDVRPTPAQVAAVLPRFTGPVDQMPPAYSALMVDGERAYDLARKGEQFELKCRRVTIHSLEIEGAEDAGITLVAHVSKGTYMRSLARDIARALGTVGHVTMLRRLRAGPFTGEQAISLDKLNEVGKGAPLENVLLPLEAGLVDIPALDLGPEQASMVRQGRVLTGLPQTDGLHWARSGTVPVALVELAGGSATVVRGFNLPDVAE
ncbi:tRNA pseudouridine(55) synthase TruB [Novosphingobium sp. TH158]|uniref:tRNA pseudouridine(55) synthase TruB n=1 Tax=Novosphingobium sp. TH158 TaxID=2067455 RepID=UPI000C7B7294|nr:tRNA pseudouridine(55) synthase TruB [Novosphingobium sp. TH158]PLK26321.1 tRNA pseudouridine(55) synthase TruB [Novosphingobium sp. TH158]